MTVRRLLAETDSAELAEWMAYEKVAGPLGADRGDIHSAVIAATVANVNRGKKPPMKIADFVPDWDPRPQDWREQLAIVKQLNSAFGGTVKEG